MRSPSVSIQVKWSLSSDRTAPARRHCSTPCADSCVRTLAASTTAASRCSALRPTASRGSVSPAPSRAWASGQDLLFRKMSSPDRGCVRAYFRRSSPCRAPIGSRPSSPRKPTRSSTGSASPATREPTPARCPMGYRNGSSSLGPSWRSLRCCCWMSPSADSRLRTSMSSPPSSSSSALGCASPSSSTTSIS